MTFRVEGLDHVALSVADQQRSVEFYRDVLGLRREHEEEWQDTPAALAAGGSGVALFAAPAQHAEAGLRHIAFRVDRDNFVAAQEHLRRREIPFEFRDHGIAHSIYFLDPDGIQLELTTYEV